MTPRQLIAPLVLALAFVMLGCATGPQLPAPQRALGAGQRSIDNSIARAFSASEAAPRYVLRLRHNPTRSDVPPFEVYSHERWLRSFLDATPELLAQIQAFEQRTAQSARLEHLEIEGKFSGRRRTESGARFPVFVIVDVRQ
ncbi:MAG: hypothetical protein H0U74_06975 [Bradymonadaceae bacterium]|nr:hypothetical protein [Lujinxingiaceae bacterium]